MVQRWGRSSRHNIPTLARWSKIEMEKEKVEEKDWSLFVSPALPPLTCEKVYQMRRPDWKEDDSDYRSWRR